MKSFNEILEYLNKHEDRTNYQVYSDELNRYIEVQYLGISIIIIIERCQVTFEFDSRSSLSMGEMKQFLQWFQQAMKLGEDLEKFLQSPQELIS